MKHVAQESGAHCCVKPLLPQDSNRVWITLDLQTGRHKAGMLATGLSRLLRHLVTCLNVVIDTLCNVPKDDAPGCPSLAMALLCAKNVTTLAITCQHT